MESAKRIIVATISLALHTGIFALLFWGLRDIAGWSEDFAPGAAIVGALCPMFIND